MRLFLFSFHYDWTLFITFTYAYILIVCLFICHFIVFVRIVFCKQIYDSRGWIPACNIKWEGLNKKEKCEQLIMPSLVRKTVTEWLGTMSHFSLGLQSIVGRFPICFSSIHVFILAPISHSLTGFFGQGYLLVSKIDKFKRLAYNVNR